MSEIDRKYAEALLFTKDKEVEVTGGVIPLHRNEANMDEARGMLDAIEANKQKKTRADRVEAGRTEDAIRSTPIWTLRQKVKENRKANEKSKVVPKGFKFGN